MTTTIDHAGFVAWAAEGHKDAMGRPFTEWLLCRPGADGRALRDADGRVVYETQGEWLARNGSELATSGAPTQQDLFA